MGRRHESHRSVPRHAPSKWHCKDPERHQGWLKDGQEAEPPRQGGCCGEVAQGRQLSGYASMHLWVHEISRSGLDSSTGVGNVANPGAQSRNSAVDLKHTSVDDEYAVSRFWHGSLVSVGFTQRQK